MLTNVNMDKNKKTILRRIYTKVLIVCFIVLQFNIAYCGNINHECLSPRSQFARHKYTSKTYSNDMRPIFYIPATAIFIMFMLVSGYLLSNLYYEKEEEVIIAEQPQVSINSDFNRSKRMQIKSYSQNNRNIFSPIKNFESENNEESFYKLPRDEILRNIFELDPSLEEGITECKIHKLENGSVILNIKINSGFLNANVKNSDDQVPIFYPLTTKVYRDLENDEISDEEDVEIVFNDDYLNSDWEKIALNVLERIDLGLKLRRDYLNQKALERESQDEYNTSA